MSGWQPIETAPKDGTAVLVYGLWTGEITGAATEPTVGIASYEHRAWMVSGTDAYAAWFDVPTHWMPLPPGPLDPSRCDHDVSCARCGTRWHTTGELPVAKGQA